MAQHLDTVSIDSMLIDTGLSAIDFYTNDTNVILSGSSTSHGTDSGAVLGVWAISGGSQIFLGSATVESDGSWTFGVASSALPQGSYTLQAFQTSATVYPGGAPLNDAASTATLTIDTTKPTQTVPGAQSDPVPTGKITFGSAHGNQITVADSNNDVLTAQFTVLNGVLFTSGSAAALVNVAGIGTATLTITGTAGAINSYINNKLVYQTNSTDPTPGNTDDTLIVRTVDLAGNVSTASAIAIDVYCFMAGTMIATPAGEVAVETLRPGDLVLTADGRALPVSWLGRQTVSTIFGDKQRVLPIRIKAGAIADNVPSRDLLISPDHAILIDGVLVQAAALINDSSITRENAVPNVFTYYHVEVADHSLILAENTPAETFVDNVDRMRFDNWDEYQALYPEGKAIAELPYPRAKGRRQVPVNLRVRLATRAQILGAAAAAVA